MTRLRGICVSGGSAGGGRAPGRVALWTNVTPAFSFDDAEARAPVEEVELCTPDGGARTWYILRGGAKLHNVTSVALRFRGRVAHGPRGPTGEADGDADAPLEIW
jgi:hypothetical protein